MNVKDTAAIEFSLNWDSGDAHHTDTTYLPAIDFWRDFFPQKLEQAIKQMKAGENCRVDFSAGELVPGFFSRKIIEFHQNGFDSSQSPFPVSAEVGRFYPSGYAHKALNCFPQNVTPFRIIAMENEMITADSNHPLAQYPISVHARMLSRKIAGAERGGTCQDISEVITKDGPGMQRLCQNAYNISLGQSPLPRENNQPDSDFYSYPRMVPHLDSCAREHIRERYGKLLKPGNRILDLMSSWDSHLPDTLSDCHVKGLGMNAEELDANAKLDTRLVQDLNQTPKLPMDDNSFDAVICTASIEYLTRPVAVLQEVRRVLSPNGIFIISFSDRWFPGKQIAVWGQMHPFERLGLVLKMCMNAELSNLHTETIRGYPRPWDDPHIRERYTSDPVFAVWGNA
ncbi:methyltransferase domain-containing protein [uncultured Desulfobacter sp.]|uniref:class I SAM-dependent methyltransferase n=1 Tax=uncultured Desulfobacter sp. TaxID=240139 RepID=UPI002AA62420|nr:methyltransferase domain-containing protein [uncultured Desulfobacter sp.]